MENTDYANEKRPAYNDVFKRAVFSLFAAHFIIIYGDKEDISSIIKHFDYYNALVSGFVIAFLVLYYIWMITRYLDGKLDWFLDTHKRVIAQLCLGVIPPAAIAAFLAWVYFSMYGYDIRETSYFDSDFPIIVLLIFFANIYYFLYYLIASFWPRDDIGPRQLSTLWTDEPLTAGYALQQEQYRQVILVHTPLKSIPVPVEEIGYFFRESKQNYLRKKDGEVYEVNVSLDELESSLDPLVFFRINRQMIISFSSCKEIRPTSGPRLELELLPVCNVAVLVSETKVTAFRNWIER